VRKAGAGVAGLDAVHQTQTNQARKFQRWNQAFDLEYGTSRHEIQFDGHSGILSWEHPIIKSGPAPRFTITMQTGFLLR
jgi:hypothetical protein